MSYNTTTPLGFRFKRAILNKTPLIDHIPRIINEFNSVLEQEKINPLILKMSEDNICKCYIQNGDNKTFVFEAEYEVKQAVYEDQYNVLYLRSNVTEARCIKEYEYNKIDRLEEALLYIVSLFKEKF